MKPLMEMLLVAGGGALGAMSRFAIHVTAEKFSKVEFPVGTFAANMIGCLLIGVLLGSGRGESSQAWRLAFGIGFLGSLTTFSTFSAETVSCVNDGATGVAIANIAANVLVGLIAVVVGIWIGRSLAPVVEV